MAGNDIIDLAEAAAGNNWRRRGYLDKIFNAEEQEYIIYSGSPDLMVWLLWSMKESAYKVCVRQKEVRFYSPLKFKCIMYNDIPSSSLKKGEVYFDNSCCLTFSLLNEKYISTVAVHEGSDENILDFSEIEFSSFNYADQQKEIYSDIFNRLHLHYPLQSSLIIKKNNLGIPFLYNGDIKLNYQLSISHHGRFGSFIITSPDFVC